MVRVRDPQLAYGGRRAVPRGVVRVREGDHKRAARAGGGSQRLCPGSMAPLTRADTSCAAKEISARIAMVMLARNGWPMLWRSTCTRSLVADREWRKWILIGAPDRGCTSDMVSRARRDACKRYNTCAHAHPHAHAHAPTRTRGKDAAQRGTGSWARWPRDMDRALTCPPPGVAGERDRAPRARHGACHPR